MFHCVESFPEIATEPMVNVRGLKMLAADLLLSITSSWSYVVFSFFLVLCFPPSIRCSCCDPAAVSGGITSTSSTPKALILTELIKVFDGEVWETRKNKNLRVFAQCSGPSNDAIALG
ncbi:hypothetical protein ElyMa_000597900 [Elysia marginata]|uniref:Uncharacterized protein n=1 Tax=Elysia marginata TaxID=1093978 RepID=A0AAV4G613_9GAST|nr:hypothetical protein ElyMa_000597900 [Elysia marginata]